MSTIVNRVKRLFIKEEPKDGVEKREGYANGVEFVLSLIGCSVGLGNLWRFPYLAYRNGGGAFLIPYFIIYFLIGLPLYFLEIYLGQFTSYGSAKCFTLAPFWKGLGYSMVWCSYIVGTYYSVIVAWVFHFLFGSFRSSLIWNKCDNPWNTDSCIDKDTILGNITQSIKNDKTVLYCINATATNCTKTSLATVEYFERYVLQISPSVQEFGSPSWSLALCLLLVWIIVLLCIIFGINAIGKIVYFTALFPYVVLIIMLVRGLTLPGSSIGVKFYMSADISRLSDINVWYAAGNQVFFSLGLAQGQIAMYSSYNKFKNHFFKQTCIIVVIDCLTSFFSGFVVFSILGFLAHTTKRNVENVVSSGAGLAFITYPEAVANMPVGPLWSILFFFMLFTLGIDSLFSLTEVFVVMITDTFEFLRRYKPIVCIFVCFATYLISLPLVCPGGLYIFEALSDVSTTQTFFILGLLEVLVVIYIYGFNNVMEDIKMMLKIRPVEPYFFITWCIATPLLILIVLIISYANFEFPKTNGIPITTGVTIFAFVIVGYTLIYIPLGMIYETYKAIRYSKVPNDPSMPYYLRLIKYLNTPAKSWGPKEQENRIGRYKKTAEPVDENEIEVHDIKVFKF